MKIGINARFLLQPYTGIGQYTRCLIEALAKVDFKNEYFLFTPELMDWNLPDHFHPIRVPEKAYRSASFRKAHWEHTLIPNEMAKWKVDLAHFPYPSNPWKRLPIPTIVTVHDVIPWRLSAYNTHLRSKLYHFYARLALKKANHIITVSQFSKQEIISLFGIKPKNIAVIYEAPPTPSHHLDLPELSLRRDFLLYVGGYDVRKNVPNLIKAYLKHIANHYRIDLILVGSKDRGLESYVTDAYCERVGGHFPVRAKGSVIFTPPLTNNELTALYKQASMLVHASYYEGFNFPLVEAMSHGLPIVAADIPVNHEVTGGAALFVDPLSIDSIGVGIHQLLNDKALKQKLSRDGLQKSKEYRWEKTAQETLEVYNLFA
ncbi:hypothetical protein COY07_05890 [Candidatus Peregrinibacteria bacterium CG_4_10_14_0_2_um_filter_43_11]|nr:MAG: hypothetical protein COY07_05890 [Candidatus Peregrinibacteria bacterium CG_4_10_14_0_2_um_filter_43_11]